MRCVARLSLVLLALTISVGPVLAAPVTVVGAPSIHAPAPGPTSSPLARVLTALAGASALGLTIKRDIGSIAQKFVTRAQAAQGDYKTGVQASGPKWEQATAAAEPAYEAGVQAAISSKRFSKNVAGQGTKYQTNAVNLGATRYGPGVANASDAYAKGMAPVIQTLQGINLPPKSFRGSPQNQARSNAVATALAAMRANK